MTCSVYASRTRPLTMLVALILVLPAWGYFFLPITRTPSALQIATGAPLVAALLGCIVYLLARKPLLRVDETGIAYHPGRFPKIDWADVLGVERVPLIEPTPDGLINHVRDGWRPVHFLVVGSDKYLRRVPTGSRQRPNVDKGTDAVTFRFAFVGRSPASAEVYECARHYLDARGVGA